MIKSLLFKIAQKDDEAFERLYNLTYSKVYVYIFRIIKDRNITEELVNDTYVKI
jgi:RNA polymerase sigma-70 factor (ECF subfamily)